MTDQTNRKPFRVGILGAGGIAETHARVLSQIEGVAVIGICDIQLSKAESFRDKFKLQSAYARLESMLEEARPDLVHLAVSPFAHAPTALTCLNAGVGVFVEKPFCLSSEECTQVARAAARSSAKIGVNHNMVFDPAIQRMIEAVSKGRLGQIEHVSIALNILTPEIANGPYSHFIFQKTGNIIFELGVHQLALINRLFGKVLEAKTLCSQETTLPSGVKFYSHWQIALRCERGTASLMLSLASGFRDIWVNLQGEDGACHVDLRHNTVSFHVKHHALGPNADLRDSIFHARSILGDGLRHYKNYLKSSLRRKAPYPVQDAAMESSIRAFYDALNCGSKPPMSEVEGANAVAACELVVASQLASQDKYAEVSVHG